MTAWIMHRLALKHRSVWCRLRTARWRWSLVTLPIVELMIHVSVEIRGSMEPRTRADEYTA